MRRPFEYFQSRRLPLTKENIWNEIKDIKCAELNLQCNFDIVVYICVCVIYINIDHNNNSCNTYKKKFLMRLFYISPTLYSSTFSWQVVTILIFLLIARQDCKLIEKRLFFTFISRPPPCFATSEHGFLWLIILIYFRLHSSIKEHIIISSIIIKIGWQCKDGREWFTP